MTRVVFNTKKSKSLHYILDCNNNMFVSPLKLLSIDVGEIPKFRFLFIFCPTSQEIVKF